MSIGKRILDLARANLNALLDKAGDDDRLAELSDDELAAELERRQKKRDRETEERLNAERAATEARRRASGSPPRAAPKTGTGTGTGTGTKTGTGTGTRTGTNARPRWAAASGAQEKRLRELYSQLEVPYGAPYDEVKKSFRRLMRKYHPDLHAGNPQQHKTATQLTMSLTQAYRELERHLVGGR